MRPLFFKAVVGTALALGPVQAMYDDQEEDKEALSQTKALQQNTSRKETSTSTSFKGTISFEAFPDELFVSICNFLDIVDLGRIAQVSTRSKMLLENSDVWRYMGTKYYGDYLSKEDFKENPKQKVIFHYLSVLVNTKTDLREIERLVNNYRLDLYATSFKKYINLKYFIRILIKDFSCYEGLIAQGNKTAIEKKIEGLVNGKYGYQKDLAAARELNELFVEKGDQEAIVRKIRGLSDGFYGYKKDPTAAREFNEFLVEKGDPKAMNRKIEGLAQGTWDYPLDWVASKELNEFLVEKDDSDAIERKMEALAGKIRGDSYYKYDEVTAREFNELLVKKGDPKAMDRKIEGLAQGWWGYKKDPATAIEINELLIKKCDPKAMDRKIEGLAQGKWWGYKKDPAAARELNESLLIKGDLEAIWRKINGLGCTYGYGYQKDPVAAQEFIKSLLVSEIPQVRGIGKYLKTFAMKYGMEELGYEKNTEKAIEFIKKNYVPY